MDESINVDISFGIEPKEPILRSLKEAGATNVREVKERGLSGVEIVIIGIVALTGLTNIIIRLSQLWVCGSVVDARGRRVLIERSCDLPRGTVVLIAPDGVRTQLEKPSEVSLMKILSAFKTK